MNNNDRGATMTQAEKLEALVRKAAGQSWVYPGKEIGLDLDRDMRFSDNRMIWTGDDWWSWQEIIFNHGFARALFGDGPNCAYCGFGPHMMHPRPCIEGSNIWPYLWEHHLQQAVVSDDPIDYMYKAVFGEETK